MDGQLALTILKEGQRANFFTDEIPEKEDQIIDLAEKFIEDAKKAVEDDPVLARDEDLNAILELANVETKPLYKSGHIPRSSGGYSEADQREAEVEFENFPANPRVFEKLPLPSDPDGEEPNVPNDLDQVSDKEIRQIHWIYNKYLGRARWLLAEESAALTTSKHLRDDAYRRAFVETDGTKDVRDAYAKGSAEYIEWNEKVLEHQNKVSKLSALVEIYSSNVDRASREWTMRTDQYERGTR